MHADSYMSDTYPWAGPLGIDPEVHSLRMSRLVGNCVSATFDRKGRLIATCVTLLGVKLVALDPESLEILVEQKLSTVLMIGENFGGGVYFHLTQDDDVLLATADYRLREYRLEGEGRALRFEVVRDVDLAPALEQFSSDTHSIVDAMPDWKGDVFFITRAGLVGVVQAGTDAVQILALEDEGIDNAMAVAENGVFIVSDHAMYRFSANAEGAPVLGWREAYDRGSGRKPGAMGHGSGTTPTLIGEEYVAITDNADGRVHIIVYRRAQEVEGERMVCAEPVFEPDKGVTENSLAAIGRSIVIENNFGYRGPREGLSAEPGIARIDIDADGGGCHPVWLNDKMSSPSAVPKISLANGLIYLYTRLEGAAEDSQAWYFTALDFHTGKLAYKVHTGTGMGWNNHYGAITLGPDGTAYVGTMQGIIQVRDRAVE